MKEQKGNIGQVPRGQAAATRTTGRSPAHPGGQRVGGFTNDFGDQLRGQHSQPCRRHRARAAAHTGRGHASTLLGGRRRNHGAAAHAAGLAALLAGWGVPLQAVFLAELAAQADARQLALPTVARCQQQGLHGGRDMWWGPEGWLEAAAQTAVVGQQRFDHKVVLKAFLLHGAHLCGGTEGRRKGGVRSGAPGGAAVGLPHQPAQGEGRARQRGAGAW